ncbi:MAG: Fur family transcriptional regulator [Armatimonadota bacterium]|nr:Fur family transcriptional regulator [Armatimonadota bacterium]MDR5703567.1 Fur family transcriptional regulator [Armatimonadota bacterium]MDR7435145.1 Fur family transcriptional regulator [Armatimonadota bacterium]
MRLLEVLRQHRVKLTPQRYLICSLLEGAKHHPTAEALYEEARKIMPTMSLKTVYATLHELAELGAIRPLTLGSGGTRFDPDPSPHAHLVCRKCGSITDVPIDNPFVHLSLDVGQGFSVEGYEIIFRGLCASCRAEEDGLPEGEEQ